MTIGGYLRICEIEKSNVISVYLSKAAKSSSVLSVPIYSERIAVSDFRNDQTWSQSAFQSLELRIGGEAQAANAIQILASCEWFRTSFCMQLPLSGP